MEYNTQESQGTFESVGTSDVLTQALSRPKHPGRIRGQSKFVKPSQYFKLNRSSNRDNEVLSMRCEIEELKALVRGLCANKDVAPSFDKENVPTVDPQNSFKASCFVQEKQHGVSDPPTMPVDSQEYKLYIFDEVHGGQLLVAFGRAWLESLPSDTVHGIPLGEGNVRVSINVPKLKKAALPIPTYEATTVEDAVNGFVAWPKTLVELDTSMNKASRGPSHVPDPVADRKKCQKKLGKKKVDSRTEVQEDAQQQEALFDFNKMNMEMRPLAYYAHSSMRQEISANCILVYMRYLEELCRINGQAEKFVLVSPTLISPIRIDTEDASMRERANILVSFLRDAPKGRLYLVPHNRGRHWVLGVIDPWENLVLYFDPLREKKRDDFTELMNIALTDWKIMTGEGIRRRRDFKTKISNRPCPLQEANEPSLGYPTHLDQDVPQPLDLSEDIISGKPKPATGTGVPPPQPWQNTPPMELRHHRHHLSPDINISTSTSTSTSDKPHTPGGCLNVRNQSRSRRGANAGAGGGEHAVNINFGESFPPSERRRLEGAGGVVAYVAEEEEEEDGIEVAGLEEGVTRGLVVVVVESEAAKGGEEEFGDEEGLGGEGEEVEAVEVEGEEGRGREDGREAAAVEVEVGGDGGGEI
ncbi:hypothetical protein TIFTF001_033745 [Ficus carica]|uniref:DUF8039 domain-containing protein n=1 Tax=Ficus carica TaxID=3494 RepID=A0AA88E2I8_FICCA|nr:hypothetical protein TIFTF001_033745 [Ficus carica]